MNTSTLQIVLKAVDQASGTLQNVGKEVSTMDKHLAGTAKSLDKTGKELTTKVTLPIVALGTASVLTVAKFDDSMSKAQAIMGATAEETDKMRQAAKEWGSTTPHSASAVADAFSYFALAGYDATESIEAMPGLLALASASGLDLASSADIVTDTMSAFAMETTEAGKAADIFATAQAKTNTNVSQLGEAMKYAAPAANALGYGLEDTSALLGILADNGIKGSMAGTTFTAMMRDMTKVNKDGVNVMKDLGVEVYNAEGGMNSWQSIIEQLKDSTGDMTTEQRNMALSAVFGEQAVKGINIALGTETERINEVTDAMYNADGNAQKMADTMEDNLGGAMRELGSAMEGLLIEIGEVLAPVIRQIAELVADWAGKFKELSPQMQKTIVIVLAIAAAIGPLLMVIAFLIKAFLFIKSVLAIVGIAFTILTGPIGLVILAVVAVIAIIVLLVKNWDWIKQKSLEVWDSIKGYVYQAIMFIIKYIVFLPITIAKMISDVIAHFTGFDLFAIGRAWIDGLIKGLLNGLGPLGDTVRNLANSVQNTWKNIFGINSPSKWFQWTADMNVDGFVGEIDKRLVDVRASSDRFAEAAQPDFRGSTTTNNNSNTNNNVTFNNNFSSNIMTESDKLSFIEQFKPQLRQVL
jgi:TP901 family phage tail tape measure protein